MDTALLIEYIKYRLAHQKDVAFRRSCEEGDVDNQYVGRYLELRDRFESMWRRLTEEVSCNAFGNGPESVALFDLLRLYVPLTSSSTRSKRDDRCALSRRRTELRTLLFASNPEKIWESFQVLEQLEKGGSVEYFLQNLKKEEDRNERLVVASDLVEKLRLAWLTLNVDTFIDYNLERYAQCRPFELADLAATLRRCYETATALTRIA